MLAARGLCALQEPGAAKTLHVIGAVCWPRKLLALYSMMLEHVLDKPDALQKQSRTHTGNGSENPFLLQ